MESEEKLAAFKQLIHFKYLFLIGDLNDFESSSFSLLLQELLRRDMRPFNLFLHRFNGEIAEVDFPHLCIKGEERKKLALYPNIVIKCKDIAMERKKQTF